MGVERGKDSSKSETLFSRQVGVKAARKLKVQRAGEQSVWFGLGMTGLIGWAVAVPTILGALLGLWLDRRLLQPVAQAVLAAMRLRDFDQAADLA